MKSKSETQRIVSVYRAYEECGADRKWDPRNPGNARISEERLRVLDGLLIAVLGRPLPGMRILEIGRGAGRVLKDFQDRGVDPGGLFGVDIDPARVERAKETVPRATIQVANGKELPFQDRSFDLVATFTVFSSILSHEMAGSLAREAARLIKADGAIAWYDFIYKNPRNPHVRGVGRRRIGELFPNFRLNLRRVTVLPPLSRRLGSMVRILYPFLSGLRVFNTHYVGLLTPVAQDRKEALD